MMCMYAHVSMGTLHSILPHMFQASTMKCEGTIRNLPQPAQKLRRKKATTCVWCGLCRWMSGCRASAGY